MKIISWNCCLPPWALRRHHRLPLIASTILREKPDIICLQEVFFEEDAQHLIRTFAPAGFKYFFKYQDLLTLSKDPIASSYGKKFKDQGRLLSFAIPDVVYGKAFQAISIQVKSHKTLLINTHLLSAYAYSGTHYQTTRSNQVKEILKYLKATDNVILLGDFNFQPGTEPYEIIMEAGYADLSRKISKTTSKKLDYVFSKSSILKTNAASSMFTRHSDHAFLTVVLTDS